MLKIKLLLFIFIVISIAIYYGCGNGGDEPAAGANINSSSFSIPLKVGNRWTYDYTIKVNPYTSTGTLEVNIVGIESINNESWYKFSVTGDTVQLRSDSKAPDVTYFMRLENNYLLKAYSSDTNNEDIAKFYKTAPAFAIRKQFEKNNILAAIPRFSTDHDDTIIVKMLKLPITIGDSWISIDDYFPLIIIKKYVDAIEYHIVNSKPIYCAKLSDKLYVENYPALDKPDTSFVFNTWISSYGIVDIYYRIEYDQTVLLGDTGSFSGGHVIIEERYTLKNYTLNN